MSRRGLILVVEDDESIRLLMQMALEDEGYEVVTAENGETALALAQEHSPQLILLDLRMPIMDGWTFERVYRERPDAKAPIVVLTAAVDRILKPSDLPGVAYLTKPFDVPDLLALVERYLSARPIAR